MKDVKEVLITRILPSSIILRAVDRDFQISRLIFKNTRLIFQISRVFLLKRSLVLSEKVVCILRNRHKYDIKQVIAVNNISEIEGRKKGSNSSPMRRLSKEIEFH